MKVDGQFLIYKHTIISYHDTVNMCMVGILRTTVYAKSARVGTIHNIFLYTYIYIFHRIVNILFTNLVKEILHLNNVCRSGTQRESITVK